MKEQKEETKYYTYREAHNSYGAVKRQSITG